MIRVLFVDVFLDLSSPENRGVLHKSAEFLMIAGLFQLVDAVQIIFMASLRGLKDTFVPMMLCGFSYSVMGLGVGSLLGFYGGMQGRGLWFGLAIGLGTSAVLAMIRYRWFLKHRLHFVAAES